jgi:hypothetical protein
VTMKKGFSFSAKRSDHARTCMYHGCYYYDPQADRFCCPACEGHTHDKALLKNEATNDY